MIEARPIVNFVLEYTVFAEVLEYDIYIICLYFAQAFCYILLYYFGIGPAIGRERSKFAHTTFRALTANLSWAVVLSCVTHTIPCMFLD